MSSYTSLSISISVYTHSSLSFTNGPTVQHRLCTTQGIFHISLAWCSSPAQIVCSHGYVFSQLRPAQSHSTIYMHNNPSWTHSTPHTPSLPHSGTLWIFCTPLPVIPKVYISTEKKPSFTNRKKCVVLFSSMHHMKGNSSQYSLFLPDLCHTIHESLVLYRFKCSSFVAIHGDVEDVHHCHASQNRGLLPTQHHFHLLLPYHVCYMFSSCL